MSDIHDLAHPIGQVVRPTTQTAPVRVWVAIVGALIYCPIVTVLFRLGEIDQPTSGLLAGACVLAISLFSFPQLAARRSLGIGLPGDLAGFALFCFCCATALSTLLAALADRSEVADAMWRQYLMAFLPVLLFFVCREHSRRPSSHLVIAYALDTLTCLVAASVLLDVSGLFAFESYGSRRFGVLGDAAAWLLSAFVIVNFSRGRWMLLAVCLLCLLATASRAPIVVAILGVTLFALLRPGRTLAAAKLRGVLVVAIAAALYFANRFLPTVVERFVQTDFFSNDRVDTTRFSWEVFLRDPFFGSGYNAHSHYFTQVFGEGQEGSTIYSVPTSTLAQSLADSGVFGTIFLVAALFASLVASYIVLTSPKMKILAQGQATDFHLLARGLAAWLLAFVPINQSAGYILPNSQLGAFFFCVVGLVVGSRYSFAFARGAYRR